MNHLCFYLYNNMPIRSFVLSSMLLALVFTVGCGGQKLPPDMPKLFPVKMTITQEGKPLPEAMIMLSMVGGKWPSQGRTDANGVVTKFFTNSQYEGVAAGKFKVCVRKVERERDNIEIPPEPTDLKENYEWRQKYFGRPTAPPNEFDLVEAVYADPKTTPLEIDVSADTKEFTLEAGKAVRILYKR